MWVSASSSVISSDAVWTGDVITSPTLIFFAFRSLSTTRSITSRSVKIPRVCPFSRTATAPTPCRSITWTASRTLAPGSTVAGGTCEIFRRLIARLLGSGVLVRAAGYQIHSDNASLSRGKPDVKQQLPLASRRWTEARMLPVGNPSARRNLRDRKSTRLNSSHSQISYAVFCLKKKKKPKKQKAQTRTKQQLHAH